MTNRAALLSAYLFCSGSITLGAEPSSVIVVTGERLRRPIADTPSSVAAITDEQIESGALVRVEDVLTAIPNVTLGSGSEGPTIRGQDGNGPLRDLPAFLGGNRPRVTLQIDARPVAYNELAYGVTNLWDVERLEVYRSPQTTTQGRNSIAGAIFVYTKAPTFDWEARARVTGGAYDTAQASMAASGPVIADQLAVRFSGDVRKSRSASRITAPNTGVDYNRDRYDVFRLKLLATPAALPGLHLTASANHNRSSAPQVEGIREPFECRRDPEATYGYFDVRVDSATMQGEWAFASGWTAGITATAGSAVIRRAAPPGFGVTRQRGSDDGIETILTWHPRPGLVLLAGANASGAKLKQQIDLRAAQLGRGDFHDMQSSLGLFGQGDFKVAPRLTLQAGVRYQRDGQDRTGELGIGTPFPQSLDFHQRFDSVLPKFSLDWELSDGVKVGALIQRAYNPGGVSLDARRRVVQTYDAETLWDYELFVRAAPPGAAFESSVNAFYYDQKNLQRTLQRQIFTPAGVVTVAEIGNAIAGYNYGAEIEAIWRPSPPIKLSLGVGLLRTRLSKTKFPQDPLLGKEFLLSPHVTATIAADWRPTAALMISLRGRHHAGYFSDDQNDPARRVEGAEIVDATMTWSPGPISLSAYLRNAFDAFYLTYKFSPASRLATAGDPREFGLSADMRF